MENKRIKNWIFQNSANIVTILGLIGAMWIFVLIVWSPEQLWLIFILFFMVGITDLVDGWLSRYLKIESYIGSALDRIRDKILICPTLIILAWYYKDSLSKLPLILNTLTKALVAVLIIVEFLLIVSWLVGIFKNLSVKSNKFGKRKMFAEFFILSIWIKSLVVEKYFNLNLFSIVVYLIDAALIVTIYWAVKSFSGYYEIYYSPAKEAKNKTLQQDKKAQKK